MLCVLSGKLGDNRFGLDTAGFICALDRAVYDWFCSVLGETMIVESTMHVGFREIGELTCSI